MGPRHTTTAVAMFWRCTAANPGLDVTFRSASLPYRRDQSETISGLIFFYANLMAYATVGLRIERGLALSGALHIARLDQSLSQSRTRYDFGQRHHGLVSLRGY